MITLDFAQWAALWYVGGKVYTAAEIGSIREVSTK